MNTGAAPATDAIRRLSPAFAGLALLLAAPAQAQLAGSIALASNDMFRGESISGNAPTAALSLSLDHRSGMFAGGGASVAAGPDTVRIAYANQYAGYARRVGQFSLEAGIVHRSYARIVDDEYRRGFFEAFVGVTRKSLKLRLYVSPDYRQDGLASFYGELNGRLLALGPWSLDGHAGVSLVAQPDAAGRAPRRPFADWRLQVGRPLGRLFLAAGVAATNYPVYSSSGAARPFLSVSHAF